MNYFTRHRDDVSLGGNIGCQYGSAMDGNISAPGQAESTIHSRRSRTRINLGDHPMFVAAASVAPILPGIGLKLWIFDLMGRRPA